MMLEQQPAFRPIVVNVIKNLLLSRLRDKLLIYKLLRLNRHRLSPVDGSSLMQLLKQLTNPMLALCQQLDIMIPDKRHQDLLKGVALADLVFRILGSTFYFMLQRCNSGIFDEPLSSSIEWQWLNTH